jgi:hypothetical protein
LTALLMLRRWPVAGRISSDRGGLLLRSLLAQWALQKGRVR